MILTKLGNMVVNHPGPAFTSSSRQQSAPILKNKSSRAEHSLSKQVSNVATVIDELEYINIAAKTMDIDEVEKETIHMLVFLFMQFLSHSEQAGKLSVSEQEEHCKKDHHDHHNAGNTYAGQPCGKVGTYLKKIIFLYYTWYEL